jgi:hypothetical protein
MDNPYQGQDPYQTAWSSGHDYGLQNPGNGNPQAPDFSSWGLDDQTQSYVEQVWREGVVAAGQTSLLTQSPSSPGGEYGQGGSDNVPIDFSVTVSPDPFESSSYIQMNLEQVEELPANFYVTVTGSGPGDYPEPSGDTAIA